jgi:hypothetical protein
MQNSTEQCLPSSKNVEQPPRQPKTFATLLWMPRIHPTYLWRFQTRMTWRTQSLPSSLPSRAFQSTLGRQSKFGTVKKCVPAWQKKYINSKAHKNIEYINDLADYCSDLENQQTQGWKLKPRTESHSTEKSQSCSNKRAN